MQDKRCKEIEKRLRENTKILQDEDHQHNLTRADESSSNATSLTRALKTADSPSLDYREQNTVFAANSNFDF